jgi:peptide-methionine (R)-S-oxide reductase
MKLTDVEWKQKLTPEQYSVLRGGETECAFTGKYFAHKGEGLYRCAGCNAALFHSNAKFESGTGWPSFFKEASKGAVKAKEDFSHGMRRTEILCANCDGHLGHVFDDGPPPTHQRFCVNSAALTFVSDKH